MPGKIEAILERWLVGASRVNFVPNPGNAGDALIAAATWQLFDRMGVRVKTIRARGIPDDGVVILGGGGNLVPYYEDIRNALEIALQRSVRKCILLPHSIRGHEDLLARLDGRFTLLCREVPSFEHARHHAPLAEVILVPDMVSYLDIPALEKWTATLRHRIALYFDKDWRRQGRRWQRALGRCQLDEHGRLVILRSDCESVGLQPTNPELDLPTHYHIKRTHRAGAEQVSMDIIRLLRRAHSVKTDRLHIALPAVLLGLPLELVDNSYGKLRSVLDLAFPGVAMNNFSNDSRG